MQNKQRVKLINILTEMDVLNNDKGNVTEVIFLSISPYE